MDASALTASATAASSRDYVVTAPLLLLALAIWGVELYQRGGFRLGAEVSGPRAKASLGLLRGLLPEVCALAVLAAAATAVLCIGGNKGAPINTAEDAQLWQEIQSEWPLLTTADSLVALQALLRLVLLGSALLRGAEARASPLAGEPAALFLLAQVSRVTLLALSPRDVYHLDGPLGGALNVLAEVVALPGLAYLSLCGTKRSGALARWTAVAAAALATALAAQGNRMALADPQDAHLDVLFSLSLLLELPAAAAFLLRSLGAAGCAPAAPDGGAFSAFVHVLLPLMQILPLYFLLTAWGGGVLQAIPELVGAGRPFEVLQVCGAAQVGLYLLAGALRLALSGEEPQEAAAYLLV